MEKTFKEELQMWALDCDGGHVLHRIGSEEWLPIRHTHVKDPDNWERVALEDVPPYTPAQYAARVSELIHARYSVDDEIALAANANSPALLADEERASEFASEYEAYQSFRAECKAAAKAALLESKPNWAGLSPVLDTGEGAPTEPENT